jgi:murein DD-endopeptidase MepM/ murein hydrolase activator NlpD
MNMKNIKDKITRKINRQSVKTFLQKQGLYVLIFLCVAAAGITAIIAWPRDDGNQAQVGDNGQGASVVGDTSLDDELAMLTPKPSVSPSAAVAPTPSEAPKATQKPNSNNGGGSIKLKKPVSGQIINSFSGDELVFFASLNQWATHNGVDIQADKDASVVAAMAGTVTEAYSNEADGGVVIISHSDKSETIYAGLGELMVSEGDKVNAGDAIGTIGELPKELDLPSHLHFEYKVDGKWKDPAKFF